MKPKNRTPTEINYDCLKFGIIELRMTIRTMKEQKNVSDVEILRYTYKRLNELLNL